MSEPLHGHADDFTDRAGLDPTALHDDFFVHASEAYVVTDPTGHIRATNPAAGVLLGTPLDRLPGCLLSAFVDDEQQPDFQEHLVRAVNQGQPVEWETALRRDEGQSLFVAVRVLPIIDPAGTPVALRWLLRDQDAPRRAAEARLLQVERLAAIGQMASGLAHEGRNALQRSQACLEMLRLLMQDRPRALDLLTRIQRAQDDLHHLYEEVRGYSAPIVLRPEPGRLGDIVQEAWAHLADQRNGRTVHLRDACSERNCHGEMDRFLMARVFENVLENALAACTDPVEIHIGCEDTEWHRRPALRLTILDNGPGLTSEQQQKIFEPFYTTKTRGTGLGMAIARRIVEAHEGRIEATNGPAGGAAIIITLPRGKP